MMRRSETIAALAAALAKAQGEMENAAKDKVNPHFRAKYADLGNIWDAIRAPLAKNGLSVVQLPFNDETGNVRLTTLLMHASGEWIETTFYLPPTKQDAQGVGSALTYMKRYALTGMGVAPEDDDGNAATARQNGNGGQRAVPPPGSNGPATTPPDTALMNFLAGKNLTVPVPGARAGKPDLTAWAASMAKAIDACPTMKVLDDLWAMNTGGLNDLQKIDVPARVKLEQQADEKRASFTPEAIAAE